MRVPCSAFHYRTVGFFALIWSFVFPVVIQAGITKGCLQWDYALPDAVYEPPASHNFSVYVPCQDGNLYIMDQDGSVLDTISSGGAVPASPVVSADGTLYFGTQDGVFWSIAPNGQANWSKPLDGAITSRPTMIDNSMVLVTTQAGTVYAYLPDGTLAWHFSIPHTDQTLESFANSVAVGPDDSVIAAGLTNSKIFALDPNSGAERWNSDLVDYLDPDASDPGREKHGFFVSPLVAQDGTIYVMPTYSKTLFALDSSDGHVIRQIDLSRSEDAGLVAYWKMEGWYYTFSGVFYQDSCGQHDGLKNGQFSASAQGPIGNCLTLNGESGAGYLEIPDFKGITGSASRTCSAWIKTTTPSGEIMSWGTNSAGAKWIIRINGDGTLRVEVNDGYIYGTTSLIDGNWHHIAVVLEDDGSPDIDEALLYVDGHLEIIGGAVDEPVNTGQANVCIGVFLDSLRYFNGSIDEVRIYDRALTADQIRPLAMPEDFIVTRYGGTACWSEMKEAPDGTIYISFDHPFLFAVNPNGSVKWAKRLGMTGGFTLSVDDANAVYAASEDGTLYVLDSDGRLISTFDTEDSLANPTVMQNGSVLVSGQSGTLYMLSNDSCGSTFELSTPADMNRDGLVNLADLSELSKAWLSADDFFILYENTFRSDRIDYDMLLTDINRDFNVNLNDLALLIEAWL